MRHFAYLLPVPDFCVGNVGQIEIRHRQLVLFLARRSELDTVGQFPFRDSEF